MTFLELCRALARESGVIPNWQSRPSSVTGTTGDEAALVDAIRQTWIDIQTQHSTWRFRRKTFSKSLIVSTGVYTAAGSFQITDLASWDTWRAERDLYTIYDPDIGVSDEQPLAWIDFDRFRRVYQRSSQTDGKPHHWSVDFENRLCIGPKPDKAYVLAGDYVRTAQSLANDADQPIMPSDYHMAIVWEGLLRRLEFDETPSGMDIKAAERKRDGIMYELTRTQLPRVSLLGAALA